MAHYYTRRRTHLEWGDINGPFESYDAAMGDHTNVLMRTAGSDQPGQMQTLVDLATIVGDHDQMVDLLRRDPTLRAVFELGRRYGHEDDDLT
jgi:hypothetical protein